MSEVWKDVSGFEGLYQVSNLGRVKSMDRKVVRSGHTMHIRGVRLKQCRSTNDYLIVSLWKDGERTNGVVHHMVASAFLGLRPTGLWVLHRDDDESNNTLSNLYYGTPTQNAHDAVRNGTSPILQLNQKGEGNGNAKITAAQAQEIRDRVTSGDKRKDVAMAFGISYSLVKRICRGELWSA